jgi:hypothetical protein
MTSTCRGKDIANNQPQEEQKRPTGTQQKSNYESQITQAKEAAATFPCRIGRGRGGGGGGGGGRRR